MIACIATILSGNAMAQTITATDVEITPNGTADLVVSLNSETAAALAEFTLVLPQGITVKSDEEGYFFEKGAIATRNGQVTVAKKADGNIYVNLRDESGSNFKANTGTLITLTLQAENAVEGETTAELKDIIIADADAKQLNTETSATVKITVSNTTGINGISADDLKNGNVFDVKGQKVNTIQKKGLYIVNGKKKLLKN
jgi:hypothetical protein